MKRGSLAFRPLPDWELWAEPASPKGALLSQLLGFSPSLLPFHLPLPPQQGWGLGLGSGRSSHLSVLWCFLSVAGQGKCEPSIQGT